jgi:heme/copper-type cytochrome/quinol oxidase subunit 4
MYDFSNDLIYGCGLSTAFVHHHLIGFTIWLVILTEGFRRNTRMIYRIRFGNIQITFLFVFFVYLEAVSSLGRLCGIIPIIISTVILVIGYILGEWLAAGDDKRLDIDALDMRREYIYSIVYGLLIYSTLATLVKNLIYLFYDDNYGCFFCFVRFLN